MATVYVLRSLANGRLYVGFTERTVDERLHEHNGGKTESIALMRPFVIVYSEVFATVTLARKREAFLKTGHGRRTLANLILKS
jgi:predicted GIY-YIG superfamily endonuclease